MKIKKMLSLLMVTLMASAAVTGCSSSTNTTSSTGTSSTKSTTSSTGTKVEGAKKIILFQSKVEIVDQLEALAEEYKKETGVEVEVWPTTGDDYLQQLKTKMTNKQGPAIFSLQPGAEEEQMAAYLEDLSNISFINDIQPDLASKIDNKVVGIPYTLEGFGMLYNKKLIDSSKVNTTDSFIKMLEDQKSAGVNGFGLSQESYFLIGHILNTPFALQNDPDDFLKKLNAGEVKMADTPEFQEFAKMYAAIRDNSYNPVEVNYDKETGDFATGKTASIHQGNWVISQFKDYKLDFDMGLMPLPLKGNDKLAVSVPTAWHVSSQATDAEKQTAKDFLAWLYTSETGKKYLYDEFKFIPVIKGDTSNGLDPLAKDVLKYVEEGKTIGWAMKKWPAGIVDVYLKPVAEKFFTTKMTPEEFLKELDKAWADANKQ